MCFLPVSAIVDIQNRVIMNSNGLYTMHSTLYLTVVQKDKDAYFYCEVTYPVPGAEKMLESNRVNITVHCEPFPCDFSDMYYDLLLLDTLSSESRLFRTYSALNRNAFPGLKESH